MNSTTVTINGKVTWRVYGFTENGDLRIFRYVDTKNSRRRINQIISVSKVKEVK